MFKLFLHDDARNDLERLRLSEPKAAVRIAVLLQEIKGSQVLLDRLTDHEFGAARSFEFHVSKWQAQWGKGKNLWRLKIWDLGDADLQYRVIYAYIPGKGHYHVLAIAPRDFNYDPQHEIAKRIFRAYDEL